MQLWYYNQRPKGNVGSGDTEVSNLFVSSGLISEFHIQGILANNGNDKRLRIMREVGGLPPTYQTVFDTGANLNAIADAGYILVIQQKAGFSWLSLQASKGSYVVTMEPIVFGGTIKIVLNGESDNDISVTSLAGWNIIESLPPFPAGIFE